MTKIELAAYAGTRFWNVSRRPGGQYRDIDCLTVYEITDRGTCKYVTESIGCVANKAQWDLVRRITDGLYHVGRPYAESLTRDFLDAVVAHDEES